jgi:hypothetical protein
MQANSCKVNGIYKDKCFSCPLCKVAQTADGGVELKCGFWGPCEKRDAVIKALTGKKG